MQRSLMVRRFAAYVVIGGGAATDAAPDDVEAHIPSDDDTFSPLHETDDDDEAAPEKPA